VTSGLQVRHVTVRLPSHTSHPTQVNVPRFNPSQTDQ